MIHVGVVNVTKWQMKILHEVFCVDHRFCVIEQPLLGIQTLEAESKDIDVRLIGFDSSGTDNHNVFLNYHKQGLEIPTIALTSVTQNNINCELPKHIRNRVSMPSNPSVRSISIPQFAIALLNALEHSLPILKSNVSTPVIKCGLESIELIAIGASTGGPKALQLLLQALPKNIQAAIVVAQHMSRDFTSPLARQLNQKCELEVSEAKHMDVLKNGHVYLAPGDRHMRLRRFNSHDVCVEIGDDSPINFCRPSVDALFASVAASYGANCIGVVLTGMGIDGLEGSLVLSKNNVNIIVQDESSSVVWGMPGSIASAGIATEILPINEIGAKLTAMLGHTVTA